MLNYLIALYNCILLFKTNKLGTEIKSVQKMALTKWINFVKAIFMFLEFQFSFKSLNFFFTVQYSYSYFVNLAFIRIKHW